MHKTILRWRSIEERLLNCDIAPGSFGVEVLIWPPGSRRPMVDARVHCYPRLTKRA